MAGFTFTNRGLYLLAKDDASAIDIRIAAFVGAVPAAGTIYDWNFLGDVTTVEAAVSGYARQDVTGLALVEDDTGNEVTLTADAMVLTLVAAGETWTHVAWYKFNASDAAADLIGIDEPASPLITNGGNVTLPALDVTINRV